MTEQPSITEMDQREAEIKLGEYLTTSVRAEITRTQGTATCLLTVLSFIGTGASAGLAATARGQGSTIAAVVLAGAMVLLGAALLSILVALRPRLPKPGQPTTGWPRLVRGTSAQTFERDATDYANFLRRDGETLARIAFTKFTFIRGAYDLTILGLPLLAVGLILWF